MPRLSQAEIRNNAIQFVHEWKDETREKAESQTFWNEFLAIFGINRRRVAIFEKAVTKNNLNKGAIDLFWRGVLLVEQKSRGQSLDKASSQAFEYLENLGESDLPELVLLSDFEKFRLYNLETDEEIEFYLAKLPDLIHLFGAISGYQKREYKEQDPVNLKVALKLGELHDALLESGYEGQKLEVFLVRLVYCLFADDTGIFLPRSSFQFLLDEKTAEDGSNLGAMLSQLFQILDTPEVARQTTLDEDLKAFPHVNGALFGERFDLPFFDRRMRRLVIEACGFDWAKVSPAIFGSLFQSVMDKEKRRNLGAHYTSEKNILKVIHGLFLDELLEEFTAAKNNLNKLRAFHDKLAGLRFFDPACGSGNFLVITYREMRRLELEVLKRIRDLSGNDRSMLILEEFSRIDVNRFYGIEYEEFPAEIARVALWLTDHQANMELSAEFGQPFVRLPLENTPNIVHGNALRLDWAEVLGLRSLKATESIASGETRREVQDDEPVPEGDQQAADGPTPSGSDRPGTPDVGFHPTLLSSSLSGKQLYILGNPPFIGKQYRSEEQNTDMDIACSDVPNYKTLDYVCAWYIKAAKFLEVLDNKGGNLSGSEGVIKTASKQANDTLPTGRVSACAVAFVSTNSITQGEQVGVLWSYLLGKGIKIHFAHRTFKWSNEASGKAAVYCVIVGFGLGDVLKKRLFDYENPADDPREVTANNINPYLIDGPAVVITNRRKTLSAVPEIVFGNMPNDGGHLLLSATDRDELVSSQPSATQFIRRFVGAYEFINGIERFCIWLHDVPPTEWRGLSEIVERVKRVREHRLASNRATTRKLGEIPYLFAEIRQPSSDYVLIPSVSSETRRFVPIGFVSSEVIASNLVLMVPNATLYHFGVLTSTMHNAWMRQVCGRLESRYRYSNKLVYNNFPWPEIGVRSPTVKEGSVEHRALTDVRAATAGDTFAETADDKKRLRVEQTAQGILDARAKFPEATLADLYDPLTMPKELLDAHRANDEAVDAAYGKRRFTTELERLEFLFDLYRKYTEPLVPAEKPKRRKRS